MLHQADVVSVSIIKAKTKKKKKKKSYHMTSSPGCEDNVQLTVKCPGNTPVVVSAVFRCTHRVIMTDSVYFIMAQ